METVKNLNSTWRVIIRMGNCKVQTMFTLTYNISNQSKYPKEHIFTSTVAAYDIDNAEKQFKDWHKNNNWNTTWIKLKDNKNNKEKIYNN